MSEILDMRERGEDKTDPDAPRAESLGEDFWKSARVVVPRGKTTVHLDSDIVEWFESHGDARLSGVNSVLREYVEAQKRAA